MRIGKLITYYLLFATCLACSNNKEKTTNSKVTRQPKDLNNIDTIAHIWYTIDTFTIKPFLKDFNIKNGITEIQSNKLIIDKQSIGYSVYIVPRKTLQTEIVRKALIKISEKDFFYNEIIPLEDVITPQTTFYWRCKNITNPNIYKLAKGESVQYLIFNENSDTVYHRVTGRN